MEMLVRCMLCQVSGGLLMVTAEIGELRKYFRTQCVAEAREKFKDLEVHDVPDALTVPSLSVGYVRTGDILHLPKGSISVCKAINGDTLSLRPMSESTCSNTPDSLSPPHVLPWLIPQDLILRVS